MIRIAALGGSLRAGSVSAQALRACAARARGAGAQVTVVAGRDLVLPLYDPDGGIRTAEESRLLATLRAADGVLLASPTYHGGMSGLMKNVLDHAEDLAHDTPAYLDGRAVGCITVAWNEVAGASALAGMRASVQALRAWAAPMGVVVGADATFDLRDGEGYGTDPRTARRLDILTDQVLDFARMRAGHTTSVPAPPPLEPAI
ncbi:NADPH-dependent FMN reductase [Streptomyces sp. NPDC048172]|uniref:NADPH-dependent FMN reductase n=1 Tax=Streptomyces sp. NPDC048172 TaxID=3365505 RepID=UPI003715F001